MFPLLFLTKLKDVVFACAQDMALFHAALRRASLPVLHASEDIRSETESSGPFFARKGGGGDAAASAYLADTLQV